MAQWHDKFSNSEGMRQGSRTLISFPPCIEYFIPVADAALSIAVCCLPGVAKCGASPPAPLAVEKLTLQTMALVSGAGRHALTIRLSMLLGLCSVQRNVDDKSSSDVASELGYSRVSEQQPPTSQLSLSYTPLPGPGLSADLGRLLLVSALLASRAAVSLSDLPLAQALLLQRAVPWFNVLTKVALAGCRKAASAVASASSSASTAAAGPGSAQELLAFLLQQAASTQAFIWKAAADAEAAASASVGAAVDEAHSSSLQTAGEHVLSLRVLSIEWSCAVASSVLLLQQQQQQLQSATAADAQAVPLSAEAAADSLDRALGQCRWAVGRYGAAVGSSNSNGSGSGEDSDQPLPDGGGGSRHHQQPGNGDDSDSAWSYSRPVVASSPTLQLRPTLDCYQRVHAAVKRGFPAAEQLLQQQAPLKPTSAATAATAQPSAAAAASIDVPPCAWPRGSLCAPYVSFLRSYAGACRAAGEWQAAIAVWKALSTYAGRVGSEAAASSSSGAVDGGSSSSSKDSRGQTQPAAVSPVAVHCKLLAAECSSLSAIDMLRSVSREADACETALAWASTLHTGSTAVTVAANAGLPQIAITKADVDAVLTARSIAAASLRSSVAAVQKLAPVVAGWSAASFSSANYARGAIGATRGEAEALGATLRKLKLDDAQLAQQQPCPPTSASVTHDACAACLSAISECWSQAAEWWSGRPVAGMGMAAVDERLVALAGQLAPSMADLQGTVSSHAHHPTAALNRQQYQNLAQPRAPVKSRPGPGEPGDATGAATAGGDAQPRAAFIAGDDENAPPSAAGAQVPPAVPGKPPSVSVGGKAPGGSSGIVSGKSGESTSTTGAGTGAGAPAPEGPPDWWLLLEQACLVMVKGLEQPAPLSSKTNKPTAPPSSSSSSTACARHRLAASSRASIVAAKGRLVRLHVAAGGVSAQSAAATITTIAASDAALPSKSSSKSGIKASSSQPPPLQPFHLCVRKAWCLLAAGGLLPHESATRSTAIRIARAGMSAAETTTPRTAPATPVSAMSDRDVLDRLLDGPSSTLLTSPDASHHLAKACAYVTAACAAAVVVGGSTGLQLTLEASAVLYNASAPMANAACAPAPATTSAPQGDARPGGKPSGSNGSASAASAVAADRFACAAVACNLLCTSVNGLEGWMKAHAPVSVSAGGAGNANAGAEDDGDDGDSSSTALVIDSLESCRLGSKYALLSTCASVLASAGRPMPDGCPTPIAAAARSLHWNLRESMACDLVTKAGMECCGKLDAGDDPSRRQLLEMVLGDHADANSGTADGGDSPLAPVAEMIGCLADVVASSVRRLVLPTLAASDAGSHAATLDPTRAGSLIAEAATACIPPAAASAPSSMAFCLRIAVVQGIGSVALRYVGSIAATLSITARRAGHTGAAAVERADEHRSSDAARKLRSSADRWVSLLRGLSAGFGPLHTPHAAEDAAAYGATITLEITGVTGAIAAVVRSAEARVAAASTTAAYIPGDGGADDASTVVDEEGDDEDDADEGDSETDEASNADGVGETDATAGNAATNPTSRPTSCIQCASLQLLIPHVKSLIVTVPPPPATSSSTTFSPVVTSRLLEAAAMAAAAAHSGGCACPNGASSVSSSEVAGWLTESVAAAAGARVPSSPAASSLLLVLTQHQQQPHQQQHPSPSLLSQCLDIIKHACDTPTDDRATPTHSHSLSSVVDAGQHLIATAAKFPSTVASSACPLPAALATYIHTLSAVVAKACVVVTSAPPKAGMSPMARRYLQHAIYAIAHTSIAAALMVSGPGMRGTEAAIAHASAAATCWSKARSARARMQPASSSTSLLSVLLDGGGLVESACLSSCLITAGKLWLSAGDGHRAVYCLERGTGALKGMGAVMRFDPVGTSAPPSASDASMLPLSEEATGWLALSHGCTGNTAAAAAVLAIDSNGDVHGTNPWRLACLAQVLCDQARQGVVDAGDVAVNDDLKEQISKVADQVSRSMPKLHLSSVGVACNAGSWAGHAQYALARCRRLASTATTTPPATPPQHASQPLHHPGLEYEAGITAAASASCLRADTNATAAAVHHLSSALASLASSSSSCVAAHPYPHLWTDACRGLAMVLASAPPSSTFESSACATLGLSQSLSSSSFSSATACLSLSLSHLPSSLLFASCGQGIGLKALRIMRHRLTAAAAVGGIDAGSPTGVTGAGAAAKSPCALQPLLAVTMAMLGSQPASCSFTPVSSPAHTALRHDPVALIALPGLLAQPWPLVCIAVEAASGRVLLARASSLSTTEQGGSITGESAGRLTSHTVVLPVPPTTMTSTITEVRSILADSHASMHTAPGAVTAAALAEGAANAGAGAVAVAADGLTMAEPDDEGDDGGGGAVAIDLPLLPALKGKGKGKQPAAVVPVVAAGGTGRGGKAAAASATGKGRSRAVGAPLSPTTPGLSDSAKADWWAARHALDGRMKAVCARLQDEVIGRDVMAGLLASSQAYTPTTVVAAPASTTAAPAPAPAAGPSAGIGTLTSDQLAAMKLTELRALASQAGIKLAGGAGLKKEGLVAAILAHQAATVGASPSLSPSNQDAGAPPQHPLAFTLPPPSASATAPAVVLLPCDALQELPWESMPLVRGGATGSGSSAGGGEQTSTTTAAAAAAGGVVAMTRLPWVGFASVAALALSATTTVAAPPAEASCGGGDPVHPPLSLPIYESLVSAARSMATTTQMHHHHHHSKPAALSPPRRRRLTYLVNPSGDLVRTQATIMPVLQEVAAAAAAAAASSNSNTISAPAAASRVPGGWSIDGIAGRAPPTSPTEAIAALLSPSSSDLYLYCGHGAGEVFISRDAVARLAVPGPPGSLLMGCSSGRMARPGPSLITPPSTPVVDGSSASASSNTYPCTPLDGGCLGYLLAGCPSVTGCLWDVTDRDIDRYTAALVRSVTGTDTSAPPSSIAAAVSIHRSICKLPWLIGCAPVVYGVPCV